VLALHADPSQCPCQGWSHNLVLLVLTEPRPWQALQGMRNMGPLHYWLHVLLRWLIWSQEHTHTCLLLHISRTCASAGQRSAERRSAVLPCSVPQHRCQLGPCHAVGLLPPKNRVRMHRGQGLGQAASLDVQMTAQTPGWGRR
jgi:hypothetical protein